MVEVTMMTMTIIMTVVVYNKEPTEGHSFATRIRRAVYSKGLLSIRCHVEPSV